MLYLGSTCILLCTKIFSANLNLWDIDYFSKSAQCLKSMRGFSDSRKVSFVNLFENKFDVSRCFLLSESNKHRIPETHFLISRLENRGVKVFSNWVLPDFRVCICCRNNLTSFSRRRHSCHWHASQWRLWLTGHEADPYSWSGKHGCMRVVWAEPSYQHLICL